MFASRTNWHLAQNRYSQAVSEFRLRGRPFLDLTVSNPTECEIHYNADCILSALQNPASLGYHPQPQGLLSAREAVARYYRERAGKSSPRSREVDPESILLTASTSEAYWFLLRLLCEPGGEVLVPQPSYPLFQFLADISDVKLVPYLLIYDHGWLIDFHSLEQATTSRAQVVIVVHPNNPTGCYVKDHERERLANLCAERKLSLIADEVFLDYQMESNAPASFTSGEEKILTFALSGLSKVAALPQMKVAWMVARGPDSLVHQALSRLEIIADTYLSLSTPIQLALPELLEQRSSMQNQIKTRLRQNLQELDIQLNQQSHCSRLKIEGGWNAVLRVPATRGDEELAIDLLQQQEVLVQPGHFYDFPSDGYLVISLLTLPQVFAAGLKRLLRSVN